MPKPRPIQPLLPVQPRLFTIPDAAAYLRVTFWFVEELLRDGKLEYRIIGKSGRLIEKEDLDRFVDSVPKQSGKLAGVGNAI